MTEAPRKTPNSPLDPDGTGSTWPWLVSPLAMALAFLLLIAALLIGSCHGQ